MAKVFAGKFNGHNAHKRASIQEDVGRNVPFSKTTEFYFKLLTSVALVEIHTFRMGQTRTIFSFA